MYIKIGICDDKAEDIEVLTSELYKYNETFVISTYKDGRYLLEDCLRSEKLFDIVFLDIQMPGMNGIEIASRLQQKMKDFIIIFISSSEDYYSQSYSVFAFNYLIKPVQYETLKSVLDRAMDRVKKDREDQIVFSYKGLSYRIFIKDIIYIESENKHIIYHMKDNTQQKRYAKLDDIMKEDKMKNFIRCHQSFAVNLYYVRGMTETCFLLNTISINISKKYSKDAKAKYYNFLCSYV